MLCPVSKLPVELLTKIFHLTRLLAVSVDSFSREEKWKEIDWVTLSWVCQQWRDVALNDPRLWTELPTHFPGWAAAMLERSAQSDIMVDFQRTTFGVGDQIAPLLVNHVSRIQNMALWTETFHSLQDEFLLFSSTPRLTALRIKAAFGMPDIGLEALGFRLPDAVFLDAANLRSLTLEGVNLNWNSHLFSRPLQFLSLADMSLKPKMAELRAAMTKLTGIRMLLLRNVLPFAEKTGLFVPFTDPVCLHSLLHVGVIDQPTCLASFFNAFSLGQDTQVHAVTYLKDNYRESLRHLSIAMRRPNAAGRFFSDASTVDLEVKLPRVRNSSPPSLTVTMCRFLISSLSEGYSIVDLPHLEFRVMKQFQGTYLNEDVLGDVLKEIFVAFNWENLQELSLAGLDWFFGDTLADTFGTLATVQMITVGRSSVQSLMDALLVGSDNWESGNNSSTPVAFSGLKIIRMVGVSFDNIHDDEGWDGSELDICLSFRKRQGAAIQEVHLEACSNLCRDDIIGFTYDADVIIWDGKEYRKGVHREDDSSDEDSDDEDRLSAQDDECEDNLWGEDDNNA